MSDSQSNVHKAVERAARARAASPFLSTAEAALYLKISERTLKEWRWHCKGPCFRRHAGHVLYHIDDLDIWSQASAKTAASMGAGQ
jgi:hypothetical protein